MKTITTHIVNPVNDKLKINIIDEPGAGGANHYYTITGFDTETNKSVMHLEEYNWTRHSIIFQNGPINEVGVNGITQEALLAIVAHRLESFQSGPFANEYNRKALEHVLEALKLLKARTLDRMNRGVEGQYRA